MGEPGESASESMGGEAVTAGGPRLRPPWARGSRRWRTLQGIAAVVVVAALLALLVARLAGARQAADTARLARPGPLVGHQAPDFTIPIWNGSTGQTVRLSALRGRPVVVNFWATWCEPCQQEAPMLAAVYPREHAAGVIFVGVAYDSPRADALDFLQRFHIPYPCGPDATEATAAPYGLPGLPGTVFIDSRGVVTDVVNGQLTNASLSLGLRSLSR